MSYTRINWQDLPSTQTPRNATNLNKMDAAIKEHDDELLGNKPMGNVVVNGIRSKNMFNKDAVQRNKFIPTDSTSETLSDASDTYTTDWIPCKPSTTYVISGTQINSKRCQFKNAGGTITYGEATGSNAPYTITTPNDAVYFRIYFCAEISSATFTDVQIEEGGATAYSEYRGLGYVMGQNSNGYYRKYDDGTLEQWGSKAYDNETTPNAAGNLYRSDFHGGLDFPITFKSLQMCNTFIQGSTYSRSMWFEGQPTLSKTPAWYLYNTGPGATPISVTVGFYAIGRWY